MSIAMVAVDGSRYRCSSWNERRWATSVVIFMVVVECIVMMKVKATTRVAKKHSERSMEHNGMQKNVPTFSPGLTDTGGDEKFGTRTAR